MTSRTIRNKLRYQAVMIQKDLVKCQGHLQLIDELAEGRSNYINEQLPTLTFLLEEIIKTIRLFREGL